MKNVSAIILAAGLSQRMGAINKLLIPVQGKPMIRHVVNNYSGAGIEHITVVVGHQHTQVREALAGLDLDIVFNSNFQQGQLSSLRCGLKAIAKHNPYIMVGLGDQPLLTPDDLTYLHTKFIQTVVDENKEKTILVPYYQGQRGNPIFLTTQQAMNVDSEGVHLGCRKLIEKNPDKVIKLEVNHKRYHSDIDTMVDATQILGQFDVQ